MVVDFDGRILAQADPGAGEKIVVAPVDITALRHERGVRQGHQNLAHLRTEAYPMYHRRFFAPQGAEKLSIEELNKSIDEAKEKLAYGSKCPASSC